MEDYRFEEDESWVFGTRSIHNFKPQFMKRFRLFVFIGIIFEFNTFFFWVAGVVILGGMEAWVVLFPSLFFIPRMIMLTFAFFFEKHPYKIATSEFYHLLEEGFHPKQYCLLRALGTHGGWGAFGVWCGLAKFVHFPLVFFSIAGFLITLIFHENNDVGLMLFSIFAAIVTLVETPIVDFLIVYFGVRKPRDSYLNAPKEPDSDLLKDFI